MTVGQMRMGEVGEENSLLYDYLLKMVFAKREWRNQELLYPIWVEAKKDCEKNKFQIFFLLTNTCKHNGKMNKNM